MDYVSLFLDNIQFALSLRNSEFFSHCCTFDMNIMVGIESICNVPGIKTLRDCCVSFPKRTILSSASVGIRARDVTVFLP